MNAPSEQSTPQAEAAPEAAPTTPAPLFTQSIGVALSEKYDVVAEDLRQANELTASLEQQLAGKSKEMLHLKFLFEQTKAHLGHMQDGIAAMRKERHKLANEAMRAMGLDLMVKRLTTERDRYKTELESVLEGLAAEKAGQGLNFDKRDRQIANLTFELVSARRELSNAQRELAEFKRSLPPPAHAPAAPAPAPRHTSLKTSAETDNWAEPDPEGVEVIPTERVGGGRKP